MKLELDDILTRVSRTEDDRAEYVRMAESWEKMWRMEVFSKSAEAAIAQDGQEQITLPTGYNIIQLASRLIGNKPGIDVPPLDVTKDADEAAESCERWLVAMFQAATQINEQTLSFVPRLLVMLLTLIWAGPWLVRELMEYTQNLIQNIPLLIG